MASGSRTSAIVAATFAAFGGILFGYDTGTIGGIIAMQDWQCTFGHPIANPKPDGPICDISTSDKSLVVSILSLGTFFGALAAAPCADLLGRRLGIIASSGVFCIGIALQTAATRIPLFVAGRVIAGLGVGLVSCLVPMYQSECSPKRIRGAIVSCYQWAITIGLLLAAIVLNSTQNRPDHSSYRIPIAIQFVWAAILAGGMFLLPESPRYLVKLGRDDEAAEILGRLAGLPSSDPSVRQDLDDIRLNLKQEQEFGNNGYLDCFRDGGNHIRLRTLTGIFLQAWQQLTGVNFVFYYGTSFFKNSGIKEAFTITIITNVINVFMTIPAIIVIDRIGRRRLLLIGALGMLVCEYIVAIVGVTISIHNITGQQVLIAFVCIYIAFFASTWGPVAWVVTSELFPLAVRAKGMSLSTASNWLWNFGIGYATPYLVDPGKGNANLGAKVFFIWGSTCVGCFIFTYFFIPETKGLALEQIDLLYQNATPRTSVAYRNQLIANDVHMAQVYGAGKQETHSDEEKDKIATV